MMILLVDTDVVRMRRTAKMVQTLLPDADGLSTTDPLLAAKYAFEHPVDLLIAGLNMKRMNGLQVGGFLQAKQPDVKICLFGTRREFAEYRGDRTGFFRLLLPIREDDLRAILAKCRG